MTQDQAAAALAAELRRIAPMLPACRSWNMETVARDRGAVQHLFVVRKTAADAAHWFAEQFVTACRGATVLIWHRPAAISPVMPPNGTNAYWRAEAWFLLPRDSAA